MILITGGTGFIGRSVARLLIEKKREVRLFVRDAKKTRRLFPSADIFKGDLLDEESTKNALKGARTVIHLAAEVSYNLPWHVYERNVIATKNLVRNSRDVRKFIFASSVSVYGPTGSGKTTESSPIRPSSLYGKSKYMAEKEVLSSGISSVALRIGPVFGAGSRMWIPAIKMFDSGFRIPRTKNKTHLVHVSDVARAFYLALNKGKGVYNIAGSKPIMITELCEKIIAGLGRNAKTMPFWMARLLVGMAGKGREFNTFVQNREYDISKAKKELGYFPKANLNREIKRMVEWYLKTKDRSNGFKKSD